MAGMVDLKYHRKDESMLMIVRVTAWYAHVPGLEYNRQHYPDHNASASGSFYTSGGKADSARCF